MTTAIKMDRLDADMGELLLRLRPSEAGQDYTRYAEDPVGFIRDVLHDSPWAKQEEIAVALLQHPQVTVRSAHACGKDWLAARLALWWVYGRGGTVILTGPTDSQVTEILMRREVKQAFTTGQLPGELHVRALRPGGSGAAGILARTAGDIHGMTGFHAAKVLFVITESQDPAIDHAWDSAFACATGAEDRILTLGNPTQPDGRFFAAHRPGSGWHSIKIEAADIPNVREGRTIIPGLMTREGVLRIASEYGEDSAFYRSRVLAEFPAESTDALITADWFDRATELFQRGTLEREAARCHYTLGCDPARLGPDRTATALRQGPVVREFAEWRGLDTMATADRIQVLCRGLLAGYKAASGGGAVEAVYVDEIGLGGGVLDRLRETLPRLPWTEYDLSGFTPRMISRQPQAIAFNASRNASLPERFANMRAQAGWQVRKLLEDGALALPPLPELREELLAMRVKFGADGRTVLEGKDAVKDRIGRSPDYADALMISLAPMFAVQERVRRTARAWVA